MTSQEEVNEQRKLYMVGKITHQAYYLWLAEFIGAGERYLPVPKERILQSTDEHFNDIPLRLWDLQDSLVRPLAYSKKLAWSLSDTVCVLKAIARKVKEESK